MKIDTLYLVFSWIEAIIMLASGIFAIPLIRNKNIPKYMSNFYWYSLIAGLAAIVLLGNDLLNLPLHNVVGITNLSILFHFTFLGLFILKILSNSILLKIGKIIFYFFLLLIITSFLFYNPLSKFQSNTFTIANLGLILLCCCYYYQIFMETTQKKLTLEPSFWIVTGVFLGMCSVVPIAAIRTYLYENTTANTFESIQIIAFISYTAMYLFFIKAYICSYNYNKTIS